MGSRVQGSEHRARGAGFMLWGPGCTHSLCLIDGVPVAAKVAREIPSSSSKLAGGQGRQWVSCPIQLQQAGRVTGQQVSPPPATA